MRPSNAQRDGEIHPLSGLLFCKDCGAKMHIRIDYRNGGKRHVAYCSEYHKGKAKNPKCNSPHIIDADCSCRPSRKC